MKRADAQECRCCPYQRKCGFLQEMAVLMDRSKEAILAGNLGLWKDFQLELGELMAKVDRLDSAKRWNAQASANAGLTPGEEERCMACVKASIECLLAKQEEEETLIEASMASVSSEMEALRQAKKVGLLYKAKVERLRSFDSFF